MHSAAENPMDTRPAPRRVSEFVRWRVLGISLLLLIPCIWHRYIQAGDLGSHVYNAWLADLVGRSKAPGLYTVWLWENVLGDLGLLYAAKVAGFWAAEKVVVALCVLSFFWGVFRFVAVVTGRPPWLLTPAVAMLAYGYVFNMGFLNYYLSIGLASLALAAMWKDGAPSWLPGALLGALTWLAHPIGFLWLLAMLLYRFIRGLLPGALKFAVPAAALAAIYAVHWYLANRVDFDVDWTGLAWYWRNGADQLAVYGPRYRILSYTVLGIAIVCVAVDLVRLAARDARSSDTREPSGNRGTGRFEHPAILAAEWYVVALFATGWLPENLRPNPDAGWIGLLVSRLTIITAIFALVLLGTVRPQKWHLPAFLAPAIVFFLFLYQDTAWVSRVQANSRRLLATVPYGTRVIPNIDAPADWRVPFISHSVDRACIGRCFVYSNYEPASRQFRVRVSAGGSPLVTSSTDEGESMQAGEYVVKPGDPPLMLLYQCDASDLRNVCLYRLKPGEKTGEPDE
jgi:hypothetical protein